jgi:hypothetical protein
MSSRLLLLPLLLLASCAVVEGPKQQVADTTADFAGQNLSTAIAALKTAIQTGDANTYLAAGLIAADTECSQYFDSLGRTQRHLQFARQENGIIAVTTAAAMGLARATPVSIAGAALGFALVDSSMGAFQTNYIYAPDVAAVQTLVTNAQSAYRTTMAAHPATSLQDAVNYAEAYEAICQAQSIRHLVNDAVANAHFVANFQQGVGPTNTAATVAAATLQQTLGETTPLTESDVATLYWQFDLASSADEKKKAAAAFRGGKNAFIIWCAVGTGTKPTGQPDCNQIESEVNSVAAADTNIKQLATAQQSSVQNTPAAGLQHMSLSGRFNLPGFDVQQLPGTSQAQQPIAPSGRITVKVAQ